MYQIVDFEGWSNCICLSNGAIKLIVTTDVGPRIIWFGFEEGENLLYVEPSQKGSRGGDNWKIYGGHRLWHAPESIPRTYFPDNSSVLFTWRDGSLRLVSKAEPTTGIVKSLDISLSADKPEVTLLHRLTNGNLWEVELAPWAITALAGGGCAIVPQEPYRKPEDYLLPARPVVLWYYAEMADPRYSWGNRYIKVRHDASLTSEQKIGVLNKQGWAGYLRGNNLFIKEFEYIPGVRYPDYGCNNEIYVNGDFLEVESLGPLSKIEPGANVVHKEVWRLSDLRIEPERKLFSESFDYQ